MRGRIGRVLQRQSRDANEARRAIEHDECRRLRAHHDLWQALAGQRRAFPVRIRFAGEEVEAAGSEGGLLYPRSKRWLRGDLPRSLQRGCAHPAVIQAQVQRAGGVLEQQYGGVHHSRPAGVFDRHVARVAVDIDEDGRLLRDEDAGHLDGGRSAGFLARLHDRLTRLEPRQRDRLDLAGQQLTQLLVPCRGLVQRTGEAGVLHLQIAERDDASRGIHVRYRLDQRRTGHRLQRAGGLGDHHAAGREQAVGPRLRERLVHLEGDILRRDHERVHGGAGGGRGLRSVAWRRRRGWRRTRRRCACLGWEQVSEMPLGRGCRRRTFRQAGNDDWHKRHEQDGSTDHCSHTGSDGGWTAMKARTGRNHTRDTPVLSPLVMTIPAGVQ